MDAHLKVEIVLNEEEDNEEEKRFNEIICYDSGDSDGESNGFSQSDTTATNSRIPSENDLKNQENCSSDVHDPNNEIEMENLMKRAKSNAAQMRKYRAKQRCDPARYRQYLERERMRNYKRKYEKRIQAAQEKAQALGIPYVVVEPPNARRGRKPKCTDVSLVFPSDFDGFDIEDKSLWINSHETNGTIPVDVDTKQSDIKQQNPQISAVNINKLIAHPRPALQTLLPQEVNDRERISNFIKLEHDYVMHEQYSVPDRPSKVQNSMHKRDKYELLRLQQCRSVLSKLKRSQRSDRGHRRNTRNQRSVQSQRSAEGQRYKRVEHEDLDDLFKELAEVATVLPTKKKHTSTHKSSPGEHSTRNKSFFREVEPSAGEFSLTVSMPVQSISASTIKNLKIKEEPKSPANPCISEEHHKVHRIRSDNHWQSLKKGGHNAGDDVNVNMWNSIEIKEEPIYSNDDYC